jgi:hypothetical protein
MVPLFLLVTKMEGGCQIKKLQEMVLEWLGKRGLERKGFHLEAL